MKLSFLASQDPLHVLSSTKPVIEQAKFVLINDSAIRQILPTVKKRIVQGLDNLQSKDSLGSYAKDVQLLFFQNSVNFCYWAEKNVPKWQVEWPKGHIVTGGEYGMIASFQRALAEKVPILDATYMANLTLEQTQQLFRSSNTSQMPLLEKRKEHLNEAGSVLLQHFNGQVVNLLETASYDAVQLASLTAKYFSSFNDIVMVNDREVKFYKRAQLNASTIGAYPRKTLSHLNKLTAFADYKIPQMLRHFGILDYQQTLAQKVDSYILLPFGSEEEIEIRAATIWAIELIRQQLDAITAAEIDHALWLISQNQEGIKPYHRTYSAYY